jgi:hypothetical protein
MSEQWRPIFGWEGCYEVSDHGRVRSLDRAVIAVTPHGKLGVRRFQGRVLVAPPTLAGYPHVCFTAPGHHRRTKYVHDLVLSAFVGPKPKGMEVCHNDGDRLNNNLSNLRYDTRKQPRAVLTDEAVRRIRRARADRSMKLRELAAEYDVSTTSIRNAEIGKTWGHVA